MAMKNSGLCETGRG
ncbi:hypothetical protein [Vibrio sinus]